MVGLGSGRRSARSTPLLFLLLALVACLAFLALSYWVSSSRSAELQAHVAALDAKLRRAAADFSVAELRKHQLQVQLQNQREGHQEEVERLTQLHRQQLQSEARVCNEEKEDLNKNITSSTKIIQTLQEQFQQLQKEYGHLNQKLQELQKKLTYDITQCSNQINDQKELYEEQIKELNRKLADVTKQEIPEVKNEEWPSPKGNIDQTSKLEVKTNEVTIPTKFVSEPESDKILNAGPLDVNGTSNNEVEIRNTGVDESNQDLLDTLKLRNTDNNRNADNIADSVAKEPELENATT